MKTSRFAIAMLVIASAACAPEEAEDAEVIDTFPAEEQTVPVEVEPAPVEIPADSVPADGTVPSETVPGETDAHSGGEAHR